MIRNEGKTHWPLVALAVLALASTRPAAGQSYSITDLGTFSGGYRSYAQGINGLGHVVGQADINRVYHAFRYTGQRLQDLGTLGGSSSYARGINDLRQVVGESDVIDPYTGWNAATHAFYWDSTGGMRDLGTLGGSNSAAYGINGMGQIVGTADTTAGSTPVLWQPDGQPTDLGT